MSVPIFCVAMLAGWLAWHYFLRVPWKRRQTVAEPESLRGEAGKLQDHPNIRGREIGPWSFESQEV